MEVHDIRTDVRFVYQHQHQCRSLLQYFKCIVQTFYSGFRGQSFIITDIYMEYVVQITETTDGEKKYR